MATLSDFPVAFTMLAQMGGANAFFAMTGARNVVCGPREFSCKLGSNASGVTHFRCTLNDQDLYDVQYLRCRGSKVVVVSEHHGVYADNLAPLFEKQTGLCLTMPRFARG